MSLLYNKLIESIKATIYESLFDDNLVTDNDNESLIWTSYNTSNPELNYVKQFKNNIKAFAQCLYFCCSEYISEAPHIENFSRFIAANIRPIINND